MPVAFCKGTFRVELRSTACKFRGRSMRLGTVLSSLKRKASERGWAPLESLSLEANFVASRHPSTHLEERSIGTSMEINDVQAFLSRKTRNRPGSLTNFLGFSPCSAPANP